MPDHRSRPADTIVPGTADAADADRLLDAIEAESGGAVGRRFAIVDRATGATTELPASMVEILRQALTAVAKGQPIGEIPPGLELMPTEAATILHLPEDYLVRLADQGEIAHHTVSGHRRFYLTDVLAYKVRGEAERGQALDRMTRRDRKLGLLD